MSTSVSNLVQYSRVRRTAALIAALSSITVASLYAQPTPRVAIDNFGQVSSTYYRGAQPVGQDYSDLAAIGIRSVINLTSDDAQPVEAAMASQAGLKYFQIPMTTHTAPTPAQVAQFLALVNDPQNQPVYVHCVGGSHRTGVMTAVYRIVHDQWTPDRAFAEMRTFKFGPDFLHAEFKRFVLGYQVDAAATKAAPPSMR